MKYTVISVCVNGGSKYLAISEDVPSTAQLITDGTIPEQIAQQFDVVAWGASPKAIARQLGVPVRDLHIIQI